MARRRTVKELWFRQGVEAIGRVFRAPPDDAYLCPLCFGWFTNLDDLTREHAPPASVGGDRIALTCEECNSGAGHTVDAQLREFEDMIDFGARDMRRPISALLTVGGATSAVEAKFADGKLSIVALPRNTAPGQHRALFAHLEQLARTGGGDGEQFHLAITKRYTNEGVSTGWLRAGYLVAFAKPGYRYILRPQLDPVRRQIREPTGGHVGRAVLVNPFNAPAERRLLLVDRPATLRGVMVTMGRFTVLLPGDAKFFARLDQRAHWPPRRDLDINGAIAPWPTRPELALDHLGQAESLNEDSAGP